ncbi:uncharacterized protein BDZ99DRAFT_515307 [Mytilinidion resinicola]|uniref:Uncharacterized protein n=1 Tax=Mytilinidion resinicola TaxID=574789 RepID=A0A6A6Z2V3_9PEZI|nr:uncharacterized protein BDZ99DRAFT_515307 [Mytilinidion resinicola]KAF2814515.1 hypothetical protein BDZ99DRAFT_515307 [Mytilinidion resinicola]
MAPCFQYLKVLLNSQDNGALPTSFANAIKSLPTGSDLYTAATCELPQEVQQQLNSILAGYVNVLPDRIKNELQSCCRCQKPTGVLNFLMEHKPSNTACMTAGALAITMFGYAMVRYVVAHIEKVQKEERAVFAQEQAGYKAKLTEKQIEYERKLTELERRFSASVEPKVEEVQDELVTQIGELNAEKNSAKGKIDQLEADRETMKGQILELLKAKIDQAEDAKSERNLLERVVTIVEAMAERQQGLVRTDELVAFITSVMTKIAEEIEDEGEVEEGSRKTPESLPSLHESENLEGAQDEMNDGSELTSGVVDEHHTATENLVDTLSQNRAFLEGNTTTENVSNWIHEQAPKIHRLFEACKADREHGDNVLAHIKKTFSEVVMKAQSEHLRKYHDEIINANDVRTALRFATQALLEQALVHNYPSKEDPLLADIKDVIEQAVVKTEEKTSTIDTLAEAQQSQLEAAPYDAQATSANTEEAPMQENEALSEEVALEAALADAASADCPHIYDVGDESPKSISSEWHEVESPLTDAHDSFGKQPDKSDISSDWDELDTNESEGWKGAVFDQ